MTWVWLSGEKELPHSARTVALSGQRKSPLSPAFPLQMRSAGSLFEFPLSPMLVGKEGNPLQEILLLTTLVGRYLQAGVFSCL